MTYEELFLKGLIATVAIETFCLWLLVKYIMPPRANIKLGDIFFSGWIASFATIPYLWFLWPSILNGPNFIIYGEIIVVLIETIILKNTLKIKISQAFILSLICNFISYQIGNYIL